MEPTKKVHPESVMKAFMPILLGNCAKPILALRDCMAEKGEELGACPKQDDDLRECMTNAFFLCEKQIPQCEEAFHTYVSCVDNAKGDIALCNDERSAFETCSKKGGVNVADFSDL